MRLLRKVSRTGAVTAVAAFIGTRFTEPDSSWYRAQSKPDWQPPARVFPIVWTALYASIAASSARVIVEFDLREANAQDLGEREDAIIERRSYKKALGLNLLLNAGWPYLFWQVKNHRLSAIEAGALALSSADLSRRAFQTSPAAGASLIPYAAWTAFAAALSTEIARRN